MRIWCLMCGLRPREWFRLMGKFLAYGVSAALLVVFQGGSAMAQSGPLVLERDGRMISLEPYAPNILRVTMSTDKAAATGAPGYGFVAQPSAEGWTHERDAEGYDVYRSARMVVRVAPGDLPNDKLPRPMPLDALNLELRQHYFGGGGGGNGPNDGGRGPHNDALAGDNGGRQDALAYAHLGNGRRRARKWRRQTRARKATGLRPCSTRRQASITTD